MSVKRVSSEVAFITEPRTDFTKAAKDVEKNQTLGSWPASSIVLARKWVEPDEATIEVELPTDFAFSIFPQRSDSNTRHRARYVSIPTPVGQRRIFLIDEVDLQELDSEHVKASIKALSPEAWLSQVPSTIAGAEQTFEGKPSAEPFLAMLRESTVDGKDGNGSGFPCTESVSGVQYRALPIVFGRKDTFDSSLLSYYGITDTSFDPAHSPTDGKPTATADGDLAKPPFPAPVGDTIFNTMKKFPYKISMIDGVEGVEYRSEFEACLVPVSSPYGDGCLWWQWLFHKREAEPIWISHQAGTADGEATLHITNGKTDAIAWIASSVDGGPGKAATASFPGKPRYAGPWASVETKEVSEGAHLSKADAQREAAATLAGLQAVVTIDATANAGSDAIDAMKLRPGTIAGVRFGKQAFQFPINEVDYSFSVDAGWEIKAPVSVETNSIDYRYPSPPEPTTPPEPPEPPEPPVKPKAGLKKLYGNGSGGSIVQDLRGDWWVLACNQETEIPYKLGEPSVKKIEGLPADAKLVAIQADEYIVDCNSYAIFQSGEKILWVNTGISEKGALTINPAITELNLDGKTVSVMNRIRGYDYTWPLFIVTDTGSVYSVNHDSSGKPVVEKTEKIAGIFHPTTFLPGPQWKEEIVIANDNNAAILWHVDDNTDGYKLYELQPGEKVLLNPEVGVIVTNQRVIGLDRDPSSKLAAHGAILSAWTSYSSFDAVGEPEFWLAMADGSLIELAQDYNNFFVAMPAAAGRNWGGVEHQYPLNNAVAWGSAGVFKLTRPNYAAEWDSQQIESKAVLSYEAGACVTENGQLKIPSALGGEVVPCSFKPKRCWSTLSEATIIPTGGNSPLIAKGEILVAGEGTEAALLTQLLPDGKWEEAKIEVASPVKQVVRPGYGTAFFLLLEDGSVIDHFGNKILRGEAEGAKATAIAIDEQTGRLLIATEKGCFSAGSTRDFFFDTTGFSKPENGDLKRLDGAWGNITAIGSGFMAGPEEAHLGHGAISTKIVELTTPAVEAVPTAGTGCFLLLADGRVCMQADGRGACWLIAAAPDGWKPTHLLAYNDSASKVLAWSEDGHSELIGPVEVSTWYPEVGKPVIIKRLKGGLSKVKTDGSETYAISGGKFFKLSETEWLEDTDESFGEGSLADFSTGYPFCFRRGDDWLKEEDGRLQKINGLSGDFLSRARSYMSTAGGAVDFDACKKIWDAQHNEWQEQSMEPAVVSTEPLRFIEAGGGGEVKAVKLIGGLFKINKNEVSEPADHSKPWWPDSYTLEAEDATVEASTVSKNGSTFWLGTEGITDGEDTLLLTDEQRASADWEKLANCASISNLGRFEHGILVPLKNGGLAWFLPGKETARSVSSEGLLGIFGAATGDWSPLLVATSSSVSAAWPGTGLQESPILITDSPKGLQGEEMTKAVWGRFGVAGNVYKNYESFQASWPALEGLGKVKEARMNGDKELYVICEHGIVSPTIEEYDDSHTRSWQADGLHFEPSGFRFPDNGQIAIVRTAEGEIWLFSKRELVKTGVRGGIIADKQSTRNWPITIAESTGLTRLTVGDDGKLKKEAVSGSKPATAARMDYQRDGGGWFTVAYDADTGLVQATDSIVNDSSLYNGSTETGLTAIGGQTTFPEFGPIIYGEHGVVAVNFYKNQVRTSSWGEKLAELGLPTADDTETGDSGELDPTIDPIPSV